MVELRKLGRDDLIDEVKYGRMTPAEAEAEAARLGLEPLASRPDPKKFNVMGEAWWTLPMTVAWIAWRDPQRVLDWYDPYRAECLDWHYREWRLGPDGPVFKGHFLNERQRATLVLLSLSQTGRKNPGPMTVEEAKTRLQRALQENTLQATGIPNNGAQRIVIPDHEWRDLKWTEEKGRDFARYGLLSVAGYSDIAFRQRSVLALWPERHHVRPAAQLPPTVRPDGPGDFPLYCAAQWIATQGGTRTFDPADTSIWDAAFEELKAHIASGHVSVTGVRNGKPERIEGHIFSSALRVGHPVSDEPLDLILNDELYLSTCVYIDAEHWHKGFNDSIQARDGIEWSKLTVLKSEIAKCWPFPDVTEGNNKTPVFRTGAPGRPTPIHLIVAEHRRRLANGEAEILVTAEAESLADWLKSTHPDVPPLTPKTIQNRIRAEHRAAKNTRN
jgi:hypothetical protein